MKTIWKYHIKTTDVQFLDIPGGAQILSVQVQAGQPCIWALVNPDADRRKRHIRICGTGHRVDERYIGTFVGTYQLNGGSLVFHVFDIGDCE